jgi:hypothetical protein
MAGIAFWALPDLQARRRDDWVCSSRGESTIGFLPANAGTVFSARNKAAMEK